MGRKILNSLIRNNNFSTSDYWEKRYAKGGDSGVGSLGELAVYKANFINEFVISKNVKKIIEFGCGDGNQLSLSEYPNYIGLDVSNTAIQKCIGLFNSDFEKSFYLYNPYTFSNEDSKLFKSDLSISLDVTYHLIEEKVYELYLNHLFETSSKYVIIYSVNYDVDPKETPSHIHYRKFSKWVETHKPEWKVFEINHDEIIKPSGACDFFVYKKIEE